MPKAPVRPAPPNIETERNPLSSLLGNSPDFVGAVLVSTDGEIRAIAGEDESLMKRLAPFAVGVHQLAERAADEAGHGVSGTVIIESEDGHMAFKLVGSSHLLFTLARRDTPLGTLRHDLSVCADRLEANLR